MKVCLRPVASALHHLRSLRGAAWLVCALVCGGAPVAVPVASAEQVFFDSVPTVVSPTSALVTRRQAWLGGDVIADNGDAVIQGINRVSRPGLRKYAGYEKFPRPLSGAGIAIISTSRGVMTGQKAQAQKVGGEILCEVW